MQQAAPRDLAAIQWYQSILSTFYKRIHTIEKDNHDGQRFGANTATSFNLQLHVAALFSYGNIWPSLFQARSLMSDEQSRKWFDDLLLFRMLGHLHYRLPTSTPDHWQLRDAAKMTKYDTCAESGMFGPLGRFRVDFESNSIDAKCWDLNVAFTFYIRQYYFSRNQIRIQPEPGDVVIDGGGCFGDTALAFACSVGDKGEVHTFDFLPLHLSIIRENIQRNPIPGGRIHVHPVGLGQRPSHPTGTPANSDRIDPGANVDASKYRIESIDAMVDTGKIPRVDFIKLDIEGHELATLKGAESTIRRFRPRLAISLYHKLEDFAQIPSWIAGLDLGYRLYLDHYTIHHEETVLYCAAD
jgi:FkbM family methyltransferase